MQGRKQRARVSHVEALLVVGSGKGGVGKSTVSVNISETQTDDISKRESTGDERKD